MQSVLSRDIWDLFYLGQFDPINRMIPLTVIPLSSTHSIWTTSLSKVIINCILKSSKHNWKFEEVISSKQLIFKRNIILSLFHPVANTRETTIITNSK